MAFMMPVVKNNYEIYPKQQQQQQQVLSRSRRTSSSCRSSNGSRPGSRTVSESGGGGGKGVDVILLSPPTRLLNRKAVNSTGSMNFYSRSAPPASSAFVRPPSQRTVRFIRSVSQESDYRRRRRADSASAAIGSGRSSSTGSTSSSGEASALAAELSAQSPSKMSAMSRFHTRLVQKLKRKLGIKDDDDVCVADEDANVRAST